MPLNQADEVTPPMDTLTQNDFGVGYFTVTNASKSNVLPTRFQGKYVTVKPDVDCRVAFSRRDNSTLVYAPTASDAGTFTSVGTLIKAGTSEPFVLPNIGDPIFFIRIGSGTGNIEVRISSP